jgi:hypothetical protein
MVRMRTTSYPEHEAQMKFWTRFPASDRFSLEAGWSNTPFRGVKVE